MSKERKGMPDEIMNQVKINYKNFENDKKREKERDAQEEVVHRGYEPGEGFKRVFSGMIGDKPGATAKPSSPRRDAGFNKIFSSLVGEANLSYSNREARHADVEAPVSSGTIIEAPPSPPDPRKVDASPPVSGQTTVFERLSKAAPEEPIPEPREEIAEAAPEKEEPTPANHKMSVFERLSKHKV